MKKNGRGVPVFMLSLIGVGGLSILSSLPFSLLTRVGRFLGGLYYHLDGRRKRIALENLRLAFGNEKTEGELQSILKTAYCRTGSSLLEFAGLPKLTRKQLSGRVRFEGLEHLEAARKSGRGVILLAAHFGNWELTAQSLALAGFPGYAVGRRANVLLLHNYIVHCRESHGNRILVRDQAVRKIFTILREGKILGILCDQRGSTSRGLMINFFGHPAPTDPHIARIILKAKPVVLMVFGIRNPDESHRVIVSKPLTFSLRGDPGKDALHITRRYMQALEEMIRKHPEQWLWMHRRWMRRSDGNGR
ncbi:MAG: lysophospholipid acyltransferase family protein [Deltaproteobacteria bacterium]|nr:lysophospholipid acyltransferase family protein [Deltaproteobacteria bacterium]